MDVFLFLYLIIFCISQSCQAVGIEMHGVLQRCVVKSKQIRSIRERRMRGEERRGEKIRCNILCYDVI